VDPLTSGEWYMSQLFRVRVTPFASTGFGDGATLVFWNKPPVAASVANFRQRQQRNASSPNSTDANTFQLATVRRRRTA
jgi:hypothetical protein